jgi:aspartate dehydrogenase
MLRIAPPAGQALRVGLWGCGPVGAQVAEGCRDGQGGTVEFVGVLARHASPALAETAAMLGAQACTDLETFLALRPSVVLEAASAAGLAELGPRILEAGADLIALSPACLIDPAVEARLQRAVEATGRTILIPSGSADGVDLLMATRHDELSSVRLIVTWRPSEETPPYTGQGEPQEVFVGTARQAGQRFPRHLNFTVAIGLAGLGLDRTEVRILIDPTVPWTIYQLEAEARATSLRARVELRRPGGRRGRFAAMSGLAALRELSGG